MIPQEKITEIQHASDIVQIISEYIHLKQSGRNFIGLCPFHSEKTPSFTVNPEKKFFKCFGCGEGGTVFHFVMKQEGINFIESVKLVASKARINIAHLIPTKASFSPTEKTFLFNITNFATRFYNKILLDKESGSTARAYLQQRHINNQSIKTFCLGYAPNSWDALIKICKERNISNKLLEKVGLVVKKEEDRYYDRFRNRLIFPILDVKKQVIGFGGRTLDDTTPKYLNSPETVLFNKSNVLYGIDIAKNAILKQHRVILMEGYTDVIMAHQYGIEWSVAVLGTAISKQHLRHLRQYCNQVILLLDSDIAGWKSSDRSLDIFIEEEFDVKIAQLPKGYDPCDFLVSEGVEKFLTYINNATDFFSYKVKMAASKRDISTIHGKANAINDVLATAMKMPDIIKRNLLIKRIAEEMSIDEATLRIQQKKFNRVTASVSNKQVAEQRLDASSRAERELLYLMLSCNDLIPRVVEEIGLEEFSNKDFSKVAQKIVALYYQNNVVHDQDILYALDDEKLNKICMDIVTTKEFHDITNHKERLEAYVVFFKKQNSKKDIHQTKKKMLEIVKAGSNEKDIVMLLEEFHKKSRNIHTLKK
ncbi:MAG: DNA primase [Candidatus Jettenia sp. CY-1]|nr:MAG: DNA primase [Candidatus Jettenia sp. CY-1]